MTNAQFTPRALFISSDGMLYSDSLICSGLLPAQLQGRPCPFADNKHMPTPQPLNPEAADYDPAKGQPGDLCPPCAVRHAGTLGAWEEHKRYYIPEELLPLRLFQCRQGFWLIVPGIYNDEPTRWNIETSATEEGNEENGRDDEDGRL